MCISLIEHAVNVANCEKKEMLPLTEKWNFSEWNKVFHNGSSYNYNCIIKELANNFKGQYKCLGGNTEK